MLLAPEPQLPPTTIDARRDDAARRRVTLDVAPAGAAGAGREADARRRHRRSPTPHTTPTSTLTFELGDVPPGAQWVRLTVDGVESLLVDRSVEPPAFDPAQSVAVPA